MNISDIAVLDAICAAEREGAELMMKAHGVLAECKTGHRDIVTEYDRAVQELLVDRLGSALPGARFFCEENDRRDDLSSEHVFIIDPIDGTMNFVHRMNHSCISVAYMSRGELRAAAVYNPYVDEMFTAVKGGGAKLNGRPVLVTDAPLSETVVCCGTSPYRTELAGRSFRLIEKAFLASLDIRRQGSAALDMCSVASGRAGAYFELSTSLWDIAAGLLILNEAGGAALSLDGGPLPLDGSKIAIAAGSEETVAELLRLAEEP